MSINRSDKDWVDLILGMRIIDMDGKGYNILTASIPDPYDEERFINDEQEIFLRIIAEEE